MNLSPLTSPAESPAEPLWQRTRIRVPREDGAVLAIPDLSEVPRLLRENAGRFRDSAHATVAGTPLRDFQSIARDEVLHAAREWTTRLLGRPLASALNNASEPDNASDLDNASEPDSGSGAFPAETPIIATGHQPDFFHPGVWAKHLAVGALSPRCRAIGLNLIVDSDTLNGTSLRVPTGSREKPILTSVAFDRPRGAIPWEEARIADPSLFESFGRRLRAAAETGLQAASPNEPLLIDELWPRVLEHSRIDDRLAMCLSAARVQIEHHWGLGNLELPLSELCRTRTFLAFAVHVLFQAARFRDIYNEVLAEFRQVNRIRSQTHPVPELQQIGEWIETPFRVWHAGDEQRARVFARRPSGSGASPVIELASRPSEPAIFATLPSPAQLNTSPAQLNTSPAQLNTSPARLDTSPSGDAPSAGTPDPFDAAIEVLQQLPAQGLRFRTRALTTTLFTRLCLCDLFVHGIGGAKYDEMTDRLLTRFFRVTPPAFLTLSATALLPGLEPFPETTAEIRELRQRQRDLRQNPQRYLPASSAGEGSDLTAEKARLISEQAASHGVRPERSDRRGQQRYRRLPAINRELFALDTMRSQADELRHQLEDVESHLAANAVLKSREFSIALFPPDRLQHLAPENRQQTRRP